MNNHLRVLLLSYCAAGMIGSFGIGYRLAKRDTLAAERRAEAHRVNAEVLKARVDELRERSRDRDLLDSELLSCYASAGEYVRAIEDVKWQMSMVIKTCPGRERPPGLPRP